MRVEQPFVAAMTQADRLARARSTEPPVEVNQVWTGRGNDGEPGFRRLRVIAAHPDGGWIMQDVDSKMTRRSGHRSLVLMPEFNLRYVMEPEDEPYAG